MSKYTAEEVEFRAAAVQCGENDITANMLASYAALLREREAAKAGVPDKAKVGLYHKFNVTRTDGSSNPGQKHEVCDYFVLDMTHDPFALSAINAYANACADKFPLLAADLRAKYSLPSDAAKSVITDAMVHAVASAMARIDGADPDHLIWEGSPPEPWGEMWCRYEDSARTVLETVAPMLASARVPDGWQLVPVQSTKAMHEAFLAVRSEAHRLRQPPLIPHIWRAMLEASPKMDG